MLFVNNQLVADYGITIAEYLPDRFIVRKVLQNKLKCDNIVYDKNTNGLKVTWKKE